MSKTPDTLTPQAESYSIKFLSTESLEDWYITFILDKLLHFFLGINLDSNSSALEKDVPESVNKNIEQTAKTGKPVTLHCSITEKYENAVIEWSAVRNDLKLGTGIVKP